MYSLLFHTVIGLSTVIFVYSQLNVKIVLFQTIQSSLSTVFIHTVKWPNSSILNNSV